jgi:hypothetical protein
MVRAADINRVWTCCLQQLDEQSRRLLGLIKTEAQVAAMFSANTDPVVDLNIKN